MTKTKDLLADSKRWEALAKEHEDKIARMQEAFEKLESKVFAPEDDLADKQREVEKRENFIKLFSTHLLNKRLGKLGLHNQNQLGYKEYKDLVNVLDKEGFLFRPHAGNYSQRIVKPEKIYRFDEYMDCNWRKYYKIKVDQYSNRMVKFRRR